jgi:hypothetical protein
MYDIHHLNGSEFPDDLLPTRIMFMVPLAFDPPMTAKLFDFLLCEFSGKIL